jgi:predicted RNA-binding Zn ribbon-like protein
MEIPHSEWLARIELIAGDAAVDFVNSVSERVGPNPGEQLHSYPELLYWLRRCGLLSPDEAAKLYGLSRRQPEAAAAALQSALHFRDAAWRLLAGTVRGHAPAGADLTEVNRVIRGALAHVELIGDANGYRLASSGAQADFEQALWPAARSLAAFMTSADVGALRLCASDTCGWLFVDRSRNKMRRWCRMDDCGNRAKQRRHRSRRSGSAGA